MKKIHIETKSGELVAEGWTVTQILSGISQECFLSNNVAVPLSWIECLELVIKEVEEKKPVKRWLWAIKYKTDSKWTATDDFYTEECAKNDYAINFQFKKLLWSETEFEE